MDLRFGLVACFHQCNVSKRDMSRDLNVFEWLDLASSIPDARDHAELMQDIFLPPQVGALG